MSTQSLDLTVVGWIGTEVRIHHESDGGIPFTTFRLGSTRRWFDRQAGVWRDAQTEWFNVKVWRTAALNAARSLRKGDPVIVQGQLSTEEWVGADGPRTSLVLEASALGPNLVFGSSHFARTMSPAVADADGVPADVSGLEELAEDAELPEDVPDGSGAAPVADEEQELALARTR
ncbi:single-stranded DNA-binding protein [Cellulomonas fengjieae]|uniref:single-stranded DNA-binding protein n=1 Tax=Cellulomonas fengjieae TaxID=2819978 RepID=UPI001AAE603E|nr:single-stranded DNA-binding protein [Cellulomonas fengjieae]MBO3103343.1 single-stranded DNA-binding protein [Cellulomonas fengjieae]